MSEAAYDFEKLAREIVIGRLAQAEDLPAAAAELCRRVIVAGVLSTQVQQDPHLTVKQACRGIMGGLLVIDKELPKPAVALLLEMSAIAQETHIDPSELMTWGMEGIAQIACTLGMEARAAVREAIEEKFMGAGAVFTDLCEKHKPT